MQKKNTKKTNWKTKNIYFTVRVCNSFYVLLKVCPQMRANEPKVSVTCNGAKQDPCRRMLGWLLFA